MDQPSLQIQVICTIIYEPRESKHKPSKCQSTSSSTIVTVAMVFTRGPDLDLGPDLAYDLVCMDSCDVSRVLGIRLFVYKCLGLQSTDKTMRPGQLKQYPLKHAVRTSNLWGTLGY